MLKNQSYVLQCTVASEQSMANIDKADLDLLTSVLLGQKSLAHNWQYLAADLDKNGKINTDDLALMVKYLTGEINQFGDINHYAFIVDEHTKAMKTEILGAHPDWTRLDSVNANREGLQFMLVQLGDINPEKFAGIHDQEEIEASYRNMVAHQDQAHQVYPNPFNDAFTLQLNVVTAGDVKLTLTDGIGKTVLQQAWHSDPGRQTWQVQTEDLPSSIYLYSIETADGRYHGKLVKENR